MERSVIENHKLSLNLQIQQPKQSQSFSQDYRQQARQQGGCQDAGVEAQPACTKHGHQGAAAQPPSQQQVPYQHKTECSHSQQCHASCVVMLEPLFAACSRHLFCCAKVIANFGPCELRSPTQAALLAELSAHVLARSLHHLARHL